MHEVSLVAALVEQVQEIAQKQSFRRVFEIKLGVGALSGVEPECLEFCFSEVTRNSVLEDAKLLLERIDIELTCRGCGKISHPQDPGALFCAHCHCTDVKISKGKEFNILHLEVI